MTQEELKDTIKTAIQTVVDANETTEELVDLVNQYVAEVIGKDMEHDCSTQWCPKHYINAHLASQRERAGL